MKSYGIEQPIDHRILNVARKVRRWVLGENGASAGMCWDASKKICTLLNQIGIKARVRGGYFRGRYEETHYWVAVNGCVLDVTADQFNYFDSPFKMKPIVYSRNLDLGKLYKRGFN